MRHPILLTLCVAGAFTLGACEKPDGKAEVDRAIKSLNVIDESNLNDIMLTVADPNEAVAHFSRTAADNPDRIELQRGLGKSLVRAKRFEEAVPVWAKVVATKDSVESDKVELADVLIRTSEWDKAEATLDAIPPTYETYHRYRLEAMVADSNEEWEKSDSFYQTAIGLTTTPGSVYNNWGYSKLTRGDFSGAEKLFEEAIKQDRSLFTAKNNLVLARGAQGKYNMPVVSMTQIERAQLLHTLGLSAVKKGDLSIGKGLLKEAVETHPQHFEAAVRDLRALEDNVTN